MNTRHRINSDIYQILSLPSLNHFSVIEIRNSIQSKSNKYGNNNNARLYVARQIQSLEEAGLIISKGTGRKKVFTKTELFHKTDFEPIDKRTSDASLMKKTQEDDNNHSSISAELEKERTDIEVELTVTLAEIEEYKNLMRRSDELNSLLRPSYSETAQKAATLMAKLNVRSGVLDLLRSKEASTC
ncbi:hypothetical protein KCU36_001743 [Vibrio vulnificus]|nr:hypothetical protein [Vibrio vulnificus]